MPGLTAVEDRPQLGQPVLHRRAGEGEPLRGAQPADGPRRLGGGVLDDLRLVGDHRRPVDEGQLVDVAGGEPVGGDDQLVAGELRRHLRRVGAPGALGAVVDVTGNDGANRAASALPVVHDRQRAHDEVRARAIEQVGQRGGGLAQAHVVGEAAAEAEPGEEPHPAEAASLVVAQLAGEPGRLVLLAQGVVGQPAEEAARPRAASRALAAASSPTPSSSPAAAASADRCSRSIADSPCSASSPVRVA